MICVIPILAALVALYCILRAGSDADDRAGRD